MDKKGQSNGARSKSMIHVRFRNSQRFSSSKVPILIDSLEEKDQKRSARTDTLGSRFSFYLTSIHKILRCALAKDTPHLNISVHALAYRPKTDTRFFLPTVFLFLYSRFQVMEADSFIFLSDKKILSCRNQMISPQIFI